MKFSNVLFFQEIETDEAVLGLSSIVNMELKGNFSRVDVKIFQEFGLRARCIIKRLTK